MQIIITNPKKVLLNIKLTKKEIKTNLTLQTKAKIFKYGRRKMQSIEVIFKDKEQSLSLKEMTEIFKTESDRDKIKSLNFNLF